MRIKNTILWKRKRSLFDSTINATTLKLKKDILKKNKEDFSQERFKNAAR